MKDTITEKHPNKKSKTENEKSTSKIPITIINKTQIEPKKNMTDPKSQKNNKININNKSFSPFPQHQTKPKENKKIPLNNKDPQTKSNVTKTQSNTPKAIKNERPPLKFPEKIYVQKWEGEEKVGDRIELTDFSPLTTIFDLKLKIQKILDLPPNKQQLIHNHKALDDNLELQNAKLHQGLRLEEKLSFEQMLLSKPKIVKFFLN